MPKPVSHYSRTLFILLTNTIGEEAASRLFAMMEIEPGVLSSIGTKVSRAVVAQAMNMVLFAKNLEAVPEGQAYVNDKLKTGQKVVFDHGALRTVDMPAMGNLPQGESAFKRILEPLGYTVADVYPLERLKMTGRAYRHEDFPETLAQFFVSELHVEQFSPVFQEAARHVVETSKDPLGEEAITLLSTLASTNNLLMEEASFLLPLLVSCFNRQHDIPMQNDYETLLVESSEMAWIATEGNSFNHATDRVPDVFKLSDEQRQLGRSIKDKVEVSADGRVRQTAFKAAQVTRAFRVEGNQFVQRVVPGSFYEFISRDYLPADEMGISKLALHFDTSNAQGIFKMTDANQSN